MMNFTTLEQPPQESGGSGVLSPTAIQHALLMQQQQQLQLQQLLQAQQQQLSSANELRMPNQQPVATSAALAAAAGHSYAPAAAAAAAPQPSSSSVNSPNVQHYPLHVGAPPPNFASLTPASTHSLNAKPIDVATTTATPQVFVTPNILNGQGTNGSQARAGYRTSHPTNNNSSKPPAGPRRQANNRTSLSGAESLNWRESANPPTTTPGFLSMPSSASAPCMPQLMAQPPVVALPSSATAEAMVPLTSISVPSSLDGNASFSSSNPLSPPNSNQHSASSGRSNSGTMSTQGSDPAILQHLDALTESILKDDADEDLVLRSASGHVIVAPPEVSSYQPSVPSPASASSLSHLQSQPQSLQQLAMMITPPSMAGISNEAMTLGVGGAGSVNVNVGGQTINIMASSPPNPSCLTPKSLPPSRKPSSEQLKAFSFGAFPNVQSRSNSQDSTYSFVAPMFGSQNASRTASSVTLSPFPPSSRSDSIAARSSRTNSTSLGPSDIADTSFKTNRVLSQSSTASSSRAGSTCSNQQYHLPAGQMTLDIPSLQPNTIQQLNTTEQLQLQMQQLQLQQQQAQKLQQQLRVQQVQQQQQMLVQQQPQQQQALATVGSGMMTTQTAGGVGGLASASSSMPQGTTIVQDGNNNYALILVAVPLPQGGAANTNSAGSPTPVTSNLNIQPMVVSPQLQQQPQQQAPHPQGPHIVSVAPPYNPNINVVNPNTQQHPSLAHPPSVHLQASPSAGLSIPSNPHQHPHPHLLGVGSTVGGGLTASVSTGSLPGMMSSSSIGGGSGGVSASSSGTNLVRCKETEGERCAHRKCWRRLRAKRGTAYFVCYQCGAKWRTKTITMDGGAGGDQMDPDEESAPMFDPATMAAFDLQLQQQLLQQQQQQHPFLMIPN